MENPIAMTKGFPFGRYAYAFGKTKSRSIPAPFTNGVSSSHVSATCQCATVGGEYDVLHPCLANGLFALVNRREKRPIHFATKPPWQQPVYVILMRNGTYLCACCGIENGTLVIHPYSQQFRRSEHLRYHHDAEVIGRIVTVARKLE
jgi:hypothetical protein